MFFNPESCRNETEVESKLIVQYLLPTLGYAPETWNQEVSLGSIRLDFLVFAAQILPVVVGDNSPLSLVIEVKSPRQSLSPHISKLTRYLTSLGSPYGLLTNGKDFRIFERKGEKVNLVFQCKGSEIESRIITIKTIIGRKEILCRKEEVKIRENLSEYNFLHAQNKPINAVKQKFPLILEPDDLSKSLIGKCSIDQAFADDRKEQVLLGERKMKTIAVYHNKGGVGKTTTVVNLAAALRKRGKRILIVDLDSQANTTFAVGLVKFDDEKNDTLKEKNVMHLLSSDEFFSVKEVARETSFCNPSIDVVPAHIDLMSAENDLNAIDHSRMILIQKLREVELDYDFVIIDTPPSLNLYARVALIAADYLIIPSDLKPFANQGLKNVRNLIRDVNSFRKILNRDPINLLGVLATKVSPNHKFKSVTLPKRMQSVMERYGFEVMESIIFERDDLAKCSEVVKIIDQIEIPDPRSVFDFKPESESAGEFNNLAQEVLRKIG
jgi:chromosome partitioning protein